MKSTAPSKTSKYRVLTLLIVAAAAIAVALDGTTRPSAVEAQAAPQIRDDFETATWSGGSGWSGAWTRGSEPSYTSLPSSGAQAGSRQARIGANGSITRAFSLSGMTQPTLTYWSRSSSFESTDRAVVQISTNGSTWTTLRTHADGHDDNTYRLFSSDLSPYVNAGTLYLRFQGQMNSPGMDYFYIDTISIAGAATSATATPTQTPAPAGSDSSSAIEDGFESGNWSGGSGWAAAWSRSGNSGHTSVTTGASQAGSRHVLLRSTGAISRPFRLNGATNASLSYWAKTSSLESTDRGLVQVSTNGSTWTTLSTHGDGPEDDNTYRRFTSDLSPYRDASTVYLRFAGQMNSAASDYFYVDSIAIAADSPSAPAATPTQTPTPPATSTPTQPPAPTPTATPQPSTLQRVSGTMEIAGESGTVIENMHITTSSGPCLTIRNSTNITIRNSEIGPCGGNGIVISGSTNVDVINSFVHPEFRSGSCCDKGNAIHIFLSSDILIQDSVVAYGESNIELLGARNVRVLDNFLVNPLGPHPRGSQVQAWSYQGTRSADIRVEGNYALASRSSSYALPEGQTDAFNFGYVDGVVVKGNYVTGGRYVSGCALIADTEAHNVQFLDNTIFETGQCGIGIANGRSHTVTGNKVYSHGISGNAGNVAMYVWNQYAGACGPVNVSGNTAVLIRTDGSYQYNSFWNGGGCQLSLGTNVWGQQALDALTPTSTHFAPPSNRWSHWID